MKTKNNILYFLITLFFLTGCSVANEERLEEALINDTIPIDTIQAQPKRIGIKMQKKGDVYEIPCLVNGLKMNFIFDTGEYFNCLFQLTHRIKLLCIGITNTGLCCIVEDIAV